MRYCRPFFLSARLGILCGQHQRMTLWKPLAIRGLGTGPQCDLQRCLSGEDERRSPLLQRSRRSHSINSPPNKRVVWRVFPRRAGVLRYNTGRISPGFGTTTPSPEYRLSLLRKVRIEIPRILAAWVRLPRQ